MTLVKILSKTATVFWEDCGCMEERMLNSKGSLGARRLWWGELSEVHSWSSESMEFILFYAWSAQSNPGTHSQMATVSWL